MKKKHFTYEQWDFLRQVYGYGKYRKYIVETQMMFEDHINMENMEKGYLPHELIATPGVTWEWSKKNPEILFGVYTIDSHRLVGHLSAIPIKVDLAERLCKHDIVDTEFTEDDIQQYEINAEYVLYIAVVCVEKNHRDICTDLLFKGLVRLIYSKLDAGCKISKIIAEACTVSGEKLLSNLGFERLDSGKVLPAMFEVDTNIFLENIECWLHSRAKHRADKLKSQEPMCI